MGVLRAEPARVTDWAQRSVGAVWRLYDVQLTVYAALLAGIGLVMAYTNSVETGTSVLESGSTFTRGLLWAGLGIVAFALATAFDYRWLRTFAWPIYFLNLGLLGLTLAVGSGIGGTSRWINLGPFTFQFSELAKILMIIVLANYLAARQGRLDSLVSILGACALMVPPGILVLMQPDLGTSLVFGAILVGMLFMSGASLKWLGLMAAGTIASMPFIWANILRDYQKERILALLDPLADIQGSGYQLYQAQIAVGSGGLLGKGLTNGTQNQLQFLPVQESDFVFAILAEELGLIGGLVLLLLFVALLWRVLTCAWRSRDPFGLSFASGVAAMLLFQLVVNVGMVIGIMPITGIPLPFVTHGGASLISLAVGLGIIQSINIRQTRAEW
jgi:rod shape determining protein RodA